MNLLQENSTALSQVKKKLAAVSFCAQKKAEKQTVGVKGRKSTKKSEQKQEGCGKTAREVHILRCRDRSSDHFFKQRFIKTTGNHAIVKFLNVKGKGKEEELSFGFSSRLLNYCDCFIPSSHLPPCLMAAVIRWGDITFPGNNGFESSNPSVKTRKFIFFVSVQLSVPLARNVKCPSDVKYGFAK